MLSALGLRETALITYDPQHTYDLTTPQADPLALLVEHCARRAACS